MTMDSRKLVQEVFEGKEPPKTPVLFECEQKTLEHELSDVLVIHAWVPRWGLFLLEGGPFKRERGLFEWAAELEVEAYSWPDVNTIVEETMEQVKGVERLTKDRFVVFEVLGPTEQSEFFCMPPSPARYPRRTTYPALSRHRFDFSVLAELEPHKARELYDRCGGYILELVKAGAELDHVDAVRVADDACSYAGPNYSARFIHRHYLRWHGKLAREIKRRGKYAKLHADGNLLVQNLLGKLARCYQAFHPLDLEPKITVKDSLRWANSVARAKEVAREAVFFTGIPVDLLFREEVGPEGVVRVVKRILKRVDRGLVLAVTHRPFPGRSFNEAGARAKVDAVLKVASHGG